MLPLFPYNGPLRPALMLVGMGLAFFMLYRTRQRPWHGKLLCLACLGYAFFLLYATFLSRSVAQFYSYRLELMRSAFSVDGGFWSLIHGDFAAIRLDDLQSLEGILINLLLMAPLGYLFPMVIVAHGKAVRGWQVILCGAALSALIEGLQLITRLGMLDVDDWVFNVAGTAMGYLLYRYFSNQDQDRKVRREARRRNAMVLQRRWQKPGITAYRVLERMDSNAKSSRNNEPGHRP